MKGANMLLNVIAIGLLIYFAVALALIFSQTPKQIRSKAGLDFDLTRPSQESVALERYSARDGTSLGFRRYRAKVENAPLLILLHGSGWQGLQFDALAQELSAQAEVLVPDLRGHGATPKRRGDVDYIGQLEDDIADLVNQNQVPGQKFILAGHSSGGGLVVRFAGSDHYSEMLDGAILMAPFLKYNAPSTRKNSGGWAQPLSRRIVGLNMLNALKITRLNALPVISFNFPDSVRTGPFGGSITDQYSYRLNRSLAPRSDYLRDIKALPKFLLLAGQTDEAFIASAYEPLMSKINRQGRYVLIEDTGHLAVVDAPETLTAMRAFIGEIAGQQP